MRPFSSQKAVLDALSLGLTALAVFTVLYFFVVRSFWIPSPSMVPTIMPGDRVFADMLSYRFRRPRRGEVVVVKVPPSAAAEGDIFIKRIVAVGGQEVQVTDGKLYVDGKPPSEPYVADIDPRQQFPLARVPEGTVFVMGDNRPNSKDSTFFGPISDDHVLGRGVFTYWPPGRVGILR